MRLGNIVKLSVTIIGHNEEPHLQELLPQLQWADEIVYLDCGSEDQSLRLAELHGCRIFSRPNNFNLNINKSYAIEQATGDWIFYLDPDERIPEDLAKEIRTVIESGSSHSAFELKRRNHYFGKWLRHGSQYPDTQRRLFRSGKAHFPNRHVHEKLQIAGTIGHLENDMLHFPYVTVSQFLKKFDFYTSLQADYLRESGLSVNGLNHFRYFVTKPWTRFFRRYVLKLGFLDGLPGLFCGLFDAMNIIVRYCKLWEQTRVDTKSSMHGS